jgi:hypothetical protein
MQWTALQPDLNPTGDCSLLCPCGQLLQLSTTVPHACMHARTHTLACWTSCNAGSACSRDDSWKGPATATGTTRPACSHESAGFLQSWPQLQDRPNMRQQRSGQHTMCWTHQAVCLLTQQHRKFCKSAQGGELYIHTATIQSLQHMPCLTWCNHSTLTLILLRLNCPAIRCAGRLRCCIMTALAVPGR